MTRVANGKDAAPREAKIAWLRAHEDLWRGRALTLEKRFVIASAMKAAGLYAPTTVSTGIRLEGLLREAQYQERPSAPPKPQRTARAPAPEAPSESAQEHDAIGGTA